MKFRLLPRPLSEPTYPASVAEALDSVPKQPKQLSRVEQAWRHQVRLFWAHCEGLHYWPVKACETCQKEWREWAFYLSAVWFPRDVHRMFKL